MKSLEKRIDKIESETMNEREDVPDNLQGIYDKEQDPDSDMYKAMQALYDPHRGTRNPNDAI